MTAVVSYELALNISNTLYDEILVKIAESIVARAHLVDGRVQIYMPPSAQFLMRRNGGDEFYFQVVEANGTRVFGDNFLPTISDDGACFQPKFSTTKLNGFQIRSVVFGVMLPSVDGNYLFVQVAETCNARNAFARRILLSVFALQGLFMACAGTTVWLGIRRGLRPLGHIQQALNRRLPSDLHPLSTEGLPTEINVLVGAINTALGKLREQVEVQARFAANAAHQLRTPLAGIKTYLDLALRADIDPRAKEYLKGLEGGMSRTTHLVDRLLSLSRCERNYNGHSDFPIDLNLITSNTLQRMAVQAVKKNLDLEFIRGRVPALIFGDTASLEDLIQNLVENAILYTPENGNIWVEVKTDEVVSLIVEDNGPGVAREDREQVFERFYRVLGNDVPGSGLGLSIVKEVATAHDAHVRIEEPVRERGCRVVVEFNAVLPSKAPDEREQLANVALMEEASAYEATEAH